MNYDLEIEKRAHPENFAPLHVLEHDCHGSPEHGCSVCFAYGLGEIAEYTAYNKNE